MSSETEYPLKAYRVSYIISDIDKTFLLPCEGRMFRGIPEEAIIATRLDPNTIFGSEKVRLVLLKKKGPISPPNIAIIFCQPLNDDPKEIIEMMEARSYIINLDNEISIIER